MFLVLWEFEVKPGCEERFEKVYAPSGDWARLFRADSNYRETRLLRDPARTAIYRTLDSWTSRQACEDFRQKHASAYKSLDSLGKGLTISDRYIGAYELISP